MARKKRRPNRKKKRSAVGRHADELVGVILLAAAAFLLVSLYSYDPADADLFIHLGDGETANLGGRVGATIAAVSYQLVGLGAWLAVAVLTAFGWSRLRGNGVAAPVTKGIGLSTMLVFGCILGEYALGSIELGGSTMAAGGLLGSWGGNRLGDAMGPVGAPLLAVTASVLALIVVTKVSIAHLSVDAWERSVEAARHLRTTWNRWSEQRRKSRQRRTVIKKYAAKRKASGQTEEEPFIEEKGPRGPILKLKVPVRPVREGAPVPESPEVDEEVEIEPEVHEPPESDTLPFEQPAGPDGAYALPDTDFLLAADEDQVIDQKELMEKAKAITSKAAEFKVTGEVVAIHPGPVVTTFEFRPGTGVKYSRITNLEDDLSLALKAESIRIARLPGKATVGIEAPNNDRATIRFREIVESKEFQSHTSKVAMCVGKQIHGENVVTDLAKMPHLLIAGTTGSGKSVALNSMLLSLLYRATPDEVKLVLIDPKRLEFGLYEDIPHLLTRVVVEPKLAANALAWAVREMDRRYKLLAEYGVRNIDQFNLILKRGGEEVAAEDADPEDLKPLPYIVVIIDELADLMMTASNVVEDAIIRLSQMARAVGIHLILATQRPSVDVLTGVIKNNLPARMSFRVASKVDSRVILDTQGAETLLGKGDMLFLAPGTSRLKRVHGAYVTEDEVKRVVRFWREQARPEFHEDVTKPPPDVNALTSTGEPEERDEYYPDAVKLVINAGEASVSNLQRKLSVGYARAGRIMDMMEEEGVVGPPCGSKPRQVLVDQAYLEG